MEQAFQPSVAVLYLSMEALKEGCGLTQVSTEQVAVNQTLLYSTACQTGYEHGLVVLRVICVTDGWTLIFPCWMLLQCPDLESCQ